MKSILIIDDEKEICRSLKGILSDEGYAVKIAHTPEDALIQLSNYYPDLILLDIWFGKGSWDGVYLLDKLTQIYPLLPIIMISGHGTLDLAVNAIKKGAFDFIEKPIDVDRLLLSVSHAIEMSQLKKQDLGQKPNYLDWPFPLDAKLKKIAGSDSRVLIVGEKGTGKKRLAYKMHFFSSRKNYPIITINAKNLNNLSEDDIWGMEINGQVQKIGCFEQMQGGTIILDNIHLLTSNMQQKLAKKFESGVISRVGGNRSIPIDVRFIGITLPDFMDNPIKNGINKEFFDRFTVNSVALMPLREKRNSIASWVEFILLELAENLGEANHTITQEAMRSLQAYDWPGNVKELKNILECAILSCSNETITSQDLPSKISRIFPSFSNDIFSLPLQDARSLFEYHYLCAQLAAFEGNISNVAKVIGMERSALHRKWKILEQRTKTLIADKQSKSI